MADAEEDGPIIKKPSDWQGWIYYKLDTALALRMNQFRLLVWAMAIAVMVFSVPMYRVGGLYGDVPGDTYYIECIWETWALLLDTGIQFYAPYGKSRVLGAGLTVIGLLFASILTGFVVDAVMEKMNDLRKGKAAVKEWNHTLLIGWTDRSIAFIAQICLANESGGGGTIVVLAEKDKEGMERELMASLSEKDLMGTNVVFRSGSPLNALDLRRAACETARSIVIMATGTTPSAADAATLRVVIALKTFPDIVGHVVVEVLDKEMEYLMRLIGGASIETLVPYETLARMSLSAVKQPGIAVAYESMLGFDGDEFYTAKWPELAGKPFSACVEHFSHAVAIGVVNSDGSVVLKPDNDFPLTADTGIIVLAEDDDSYECSQTPFEVQQGTLPPVISEPPSVSRLLFIGWTDNVKGMLEILDTIFDQGTEVHLLNRTPIEERVSRLADQGMDTDRDLVNLEITHIVGNPAVWRTLRTLDLKSYRALLVISDEMDSGDLMASDSHNLACILLLRHYDELTELDEIRLRGESAAKALRKSIAARESPGTGSFEETKWGSSSASAAAAASAASAVAAQGGDSRDRSSNNKQFGGGLKTQPIFCEVLDTRTQKLLANHPTMGSACHLLVSNRLISKLMAMVAEDRTVSAILTILLSGDITVTLKKAEHYVAFGERASFFVLAKRVQKMNEVLIGYQSRSNVDDLHINPKDKSEIKSWVGMDMLVIARDEQVALNKKRASMRRSSLAVTRRNSASPAHSLSSSGGCGGGGGGGTTTSPKHSLLSGGGWEGGGSLQSNTTPPPTSHPHHYGNNNSGSPSSNELPGYHTSVSHEINNYNLPAFSANSAKTTNAMSQDLLAAPRPIATSALQPTSGQNQQPQHQQHQQQSAHRPHGLAVVGDDMSSLVGMVAGSLMAAAAGEQGRHQHLLDVPLETSRPLGFAIEKANNTPHSPSHGSGENFNGQKQSDQRPTKVPVVSSVAPGGQAASAGVLPGWVVAAVNGQKVSTSAEATAMLQKARASKGRGRSFGGSDSSEMAKRHEAEAADEAKWQQQQQQQQKLTMVVSFEIPPLPQPDLDAAMMAMPPTTVGPGGQPFGGGTLLPLGLPSGALPPGGLPPGLPPGLLDMDTDKMTDPMAREVALKLKCTALEKALEGAQREASISEGKALAATAKAATASAAATRAASALAASLQQQRNQEEEDLQSSMVMGHQRRSSAAFGDGGGSGSGGGPLTKAGGPQVIQLKTALEQERKLRSVTERMLKETTQAVSDASGQQVEQAQVLAAAVALREQTSRRADGLLDQEVEQAKAKLQHYTTQTAPASGCGCGGVGGSFGFGGGGGGSGRGGAAATDFPVRRESGRGTEALFSSLPPPPKERSSPRGGGGGGGGVGGGFRDVNGRRNTVMAPQRMTLRSPPADRGGRSPTRDGRLSPTRSGRVSPTNPGSSNSNNAAGSGGGVMLQQRKQAGRVQSGVQGQAGERRGQSLGRSGIL